MSREEQAATRDPFAADRHRFTVVGVYEDGRGISPEHVSARDVHAVMNRMRAAGAHVVVNYDGETFPDGVDVPLTATPDAPSTEPGAPFEP